MEVTQLREQKSRYDIFHKGRTIRFMLEGCGCKHGVNAVFAVELKKRDILPSFIPAEAIDEPDELVYKHLIEDHVILKWYERMIGIPLKWKIDRWAKKNRREIIEQFDSSDRAEKLQEEFMQ